MRRTVLAAGMAGACALAGLVVLLTASGSKETGSRTGRDTASVNLILNGNAGTGLCTPDGLAAMTIPGWTVTAGNPASVCYGAAGFPARSTPGPPDRGQAFFTGGASGSASMWQQADTSSARTAIDRGRVRYQLSGWLGGNAGQADRVAVAATFRTGSGATLGIAAGRAGAASAAANRRADRVRIVTSLS